MRIAIIGSGAAGLVSAWLLQDEHNVSLYEKDSVAGGHARSFPVPWQGQTIHAETGFRFFFPSSYPHFLSLLRLLGIRLHAGHSSLSYTQPDGSTLVLPPHTPRQVLGLLASRRRLQHVLYFARYLYRGEQIIRARDWSLSLPEYLRRLRAPVHFADEFLYPLLAASWGIPLTEVRGFPAYSVLKVMRRPVREGFLFYEIEGGISAYIEALVSRLGRVELRLGAGARRVTRREDEYVVEDESGQARRFDRLVFATSARDAAQLLQGVDAAAGWRQVLGRFRHFEARILIHGDERFMPPRRADWATVNVFHDGTRTWMSDWSGWRVQAPIFRTWWVPGLPEPRGVLHRRDFHHLVVTCDSERLQREIAALQGAAGIFATGMYADDVDNHESAITSALTVARHLAPAAASRRGLAGDRVAV